MLVKDTLIELCNFARENSCFYRELYKNKTINNLEEFYSLPFVNSDIYKYDYHHISTSNNLNYKSEYAFSSGGSTGEPKYIYLTDEEFHLNIKMHGSFYSKAGIEKTDRVAIFGIPGQLTSEFSVYLGLESTECFILPIGIYDDFDKISDLISHFKINTLLLMPTDAISLINYYKFNTKKLKIDKIITGGGTTND